MANMLFANNCNTTLASSLSSGATSMSVTSATGFPVPTGVQYFYCTLADAATQTTIEIVKVTAVSGTTFSITRAQDGTTATAFSAGAVVSLRLVRASLNDFPKLSETNTFNADQAISGQLTSSAGLATTGTFTATAPSDGLVMDYATGFGRFSAFAGDGFQWYNAGIANTKLMQLSSSGVITTATWNGATVGVGYGGTGLAAVTAGYIPFGSSSSSLATSGSFYWDNSAVQLNAFGTATFGSTNAGGGGGTNKWVTIQGNGVSYGAGNAGNYGGIVLSANANYTSAACQFLITNALNVNSFAIIRSVNATTPPSIGTGGTISSGTADFVISNTGGVSIGNTTDPGAGNLSVTGNILPSAKILGQASAGAILTLGVGTTSYVTIDGGVAAFYPFADNTTSLGYSTRRWTTVYATTALINTSDANDKQQIADLTIAELNTAKAIKGLIKSFKFNDSVKEKGNGARIHIGVMAQDVKATFEANGLEASKYGIFCSDTWYEVDGNATNEENLHYTAETPNAVKVTKLGVRYEELLAFVIASM